MKTYEKYKDSEIYWLSSIPLHWESRAIRQLFSEVKCKNTGLQERNLLSLSYGTIKQKNIDNSFGLTPANYEGYNIIEKDDIVLRLTDLQNDHKSLRTGLSKERGIVTSAYVTIRNHSDCSSEYLHMLLHAFDLVKGFYNFGASGVRQSLNWEVLRTLKIPVPPRPEQDQIVRYLDWKVSCINRLIHGYQRQIELLKERRMTIIDNAVTKGIRPDVPMKRIDGNWMGEIPAHWVVVPLKRCAKIRSGITLGKHYNRNETLIERPYLRVANVQNGYVDLSDVATIFVNAQDDMKYRLSKGVVLMTEGGDRDKLGRGCVWSGEVEPCLHQNHIFAVTVNENLLINKYLEYLTISHIGREYFDLTAIKTTNLACTNASKVMAFPIPLPPIDEQQEIINWLDDRLNENQLVMSAVNQKIRLLKEYRTRLISDVVTGQIDVRDEVIPDYTPETDTEDEDAATAESEAD